MIYKVVIGSDFKDNVILKKMIYNVPCLFYFKNKFCYCVFSNIASLSCDNLRLLNFERNFHIL